ncbi:MAG TPA: hypothetical protein VHV80_00380 [Steroidobacteraceae bacterium]|jgi:hypothetical protein|nr:hypothetical protein [Steroidobacteraceae bacterium]
MRTKRVVAAFLRSVAHDADSLDFLGDMGAARLMALTGAKAPSFAPALQSFLDRLQDESFHGGAM